MVEHYRIVIDVRTERPLAFALFSRNEGAIYDLIRRGRVALYQVQRLKLEKDMIEKTELIEAKTV